MLLIRGFETRVPLQAPQGLTASILSLQHTNAAQLEVDILPGEMKEFPSSQPSTQHSDEDGGQHLIRPREQALYLLMGQVPKPSIVHE